MSMQANKQLIEEFITAFGSGDVEGARRCLAPGAVAVSKGTSSLCGERGYEEILATIGGLNALAPGGFRPEILSITGDDDRVSIEFEGNATLVNGESYDNQYCMVFTIAGGRIVRLHEYCCTLLVERKLVPLLG